MIRTELGRFAWTRKRLKEKQKDSRAELEGVFCSSKLRVKLKRYYSVQSFRCCPEKLRHDSERFLGPNRIV